MWTFRLLFSVALTQPCLGRLEMVTSTPGSLLAKEGSTAILECSTTTPWFLCVWTGPGGLALHLGEGDAQCNKCETTHTGYSLSSLNSHTVCRLKVTDMQREQGGDYRCVLADRHKVETVDREFMVEVGHQVEGVRFLSGGLVVSGVGGTPSLEFQPGETVELGCMAEGGHPPPVLDIYTRGNVTFQDVPGVSSQGPGVERRVRFIATEENNNTMVSCRAEQRGAAGELIYTTTKTIILELLPPGAVPRSGSRCVGEDAEWWCGYQLWLYLLMVLLLLLLVTFCGVYFCCVTKRARARKIMYTSPEKESQEGLLRQSGGIIKQTWEPTFFPPPSPQISIPVHTVAPPSNPEPRPSELSIVQETPEPEEKILLESCFDGNQSILDDSLQKLPRPGSQPSTIGNFYSDDEGDRTMDGDEEKQRRGGLLTEYEETIIFNRKTEVTTIEEKLRKLNLERSMEDASETSSLGEEVVKYEANKYSLNDCADVNSRDLSYSQVVKEHLSHNPSLNVSRTDISFSVPAVTRMKWGDSRAESRTQSRNHSPLPTSRNNMCTPTPHTTISNNNSYLSSISKSSTHHPPISNTPLFLPSSNSNTTTLPSTARLPVHKPTVISAVNPPSVSLQLKTSKTTTTTTKETRSHLVEKILGRSQEFLTTPKDTTNAENTNIKANNNLENNKNKYDDATIENSFQSIVERHLGQSREVINDHNYCKRQPSLDGSCFTADRDFDIFDPGCHLTHEDVKRTFTNIRDHRGKVDKETFIRTTMDLFPKYNVEQNRIKLEKLFDRLDKSKEGRISFRQFMLVTIAFSNNSLGDKLTRIFKLIDKDGNGELTYEEFEEIVHDILVLKEERKMSASLVESRFSRNTFRHMGMNHDGNVVLRDFVEACTQQKFILINYVDNFRDEFQSKQ